MKPITLLVSCVVAIPFGLSAEAWTQYRGAKSYGVTSEALQTTDWERMAPKELWRTEVTDGFSSWAVSGDHAYTLMKRDVEGSPTEVCVALEVESGDEVWAAPLGFAKYDGGGDAGEKNNKGGDGPRSTPATDGEHVFVTDARCVVYCFSAKDGSQVWTRDLLKEHGGKNIKWQNAASPLVAGGKVFVAGGGEGEALLALDAKTGEPVWAVEDDAMTHATPVATIIHGVAQIIFFTQEGLVALSPQTGEALWRYEFPFKLSTAASPVVFEDIVYCSAGYGVGAGACKISKSGSGLKAEEIWRKEGELINHWSTPVCHDGYLYGLFSFKKYGDGPLACVDIQTGELKWEEKGFGPGHLTLVGEQLLILGDRGQLVVVDPNPRSYDEVSRLDILDGKCWTTPVLSDGRIFARSISEAVCLQP